MLNIFFFDVKNRWGSLLSQFISVVIIWSIIWDFLSLMRKINVKNFEKYSKLSKNLKKIQNHQKMFLMDDVRVQIIIQVLICFQINKSDITRQPKRPILSHSQGCKKYSHSRAYLEQCQNKSKDCVLKMRKLDQFYSEIE